MEIAIECVLNDQSREAGSKVVTWTLASDVVQMMRVKQINKVALALE